MNSSSPPTARRGGSELGKHLTMSVVVFGIRPTIASDALLSGREGRHNGEREAR